jgi:predicted small lipoprotein YifL
MRARATWSWIAVGGALLACGGCGFKGPLYLPERNATVVTHPRPAPQSAPSGASQTQRPPGKNKSKTPQPPGPAPATAPQGTPPLPQ